MRVFLYITLLLLTLTTFVHAIDKKVGTSGSTGSAPILGECVLKKEIQNENCKSLNACPTSSHIEIKTENDCKTINGEWTKLRIKKSP